MAAQGSSRALQLARRSSPVTDLSAAAYNAGTLTLEECVAKNILTENAVHQVGIATATEGRLESHRFPIQVIVGSPPEGNEVSVTCCGYWRLANGAGQQIRFTRRPDVPVTLIANIRKHLITLDEDWWELRHSQRNPARTLQATWNTHLDEIMTQLNVENPPAAGIDRARGAYNALRESARANNVTPYLKLGEDLYMYGVPVGQCPGAVGNIPAGRVAVLESMYTVHVNYVAMRARYATLSEGAVSLAAWAAAMMFKAGLQDAHEHKEYVTLYVTPQDNMNAVITKIIAPDGYAAPTGIAEGSTITLPAFRVNEKYIQLGMCLVVVAGLMHYMFNHTTGGSKVTGPLFVVLAMQNIINSSTSEAEIETITDVMYEALHPVNKRAIADLFFKNSKVYTHSKSNYARRYGRFDLDSFTQIRTNPYPAGSHKAFVFILALKRVLNMGMGVCLPWSQSIAGAIAAAQGILNAGAAAHIGAHYYTGGPGRSQASELDGYMPELAFFMQTFHKNDSLTQSPHLGPDVSGRAAVSFQNVIRTLKKEEMTSVSADQIQDFLKVSGKALFNVDFNDPATWASAADVASDQVKAIEAIFTH